MIKVNKVESTRQNVIKLFEPNTYFCYTYVPRKYTSKNKLTLEFAAKSLSNDEYNKSCQTKIVELQDIKYSCCAFFSSEIVTMMLHEVQTQGIAFREGDKRNLVKQSVN